MRDLSCSVEGPIYVLCGDRSVEGVDEDVVSFSIGFVHEHSAGSRIEEDCGVNDLISFCGLAFDGNSDAHRLTSDLGY